MADRRFFPSNFFNLNGFPYKDIFEGVEYVWEVLPKIGIYTGGKLMKGKNCHIHPNTNIRDGVILGDNVHIGFGVELKNCIIMDNTHVAHINYIGDAIVGENCNISGGVMFANSRLDNRPVTIKVGDERIPTGLLKFSAVVGDGTWVGVSTVLNPGTILGKNCKTYPLTSVIGYYGSGSVITGK